MTFNEFNKELEKRITDPQVRYMLAFMFEATMENGKQMDELAGLLLNLTEQQQRFVDLSDDTRERIKRVERRGHEDGIEVKSVANDPDETEH